MDSSVVHLYIPEIIILNLYVVQCNHFVHNSKENDLEHIFDHLFQYNIFEDQDYRL